MRMCLTMALAGSLLAAAGTPASAQTDSSSVDAPQRVLFIGNSHTARNGGMDWAVGNLAAAEDPPRPFFGTHSTSSGATLGYHLANGAPERIREGKYDVVVLQGHLPGSRVQSATPFLADARRLDQIVRESGSRSLFFMSWPQQKLDWASLDLIVSAHRQLADELGVDVAPAALAMDKARKERPDLVLIEGDGIHATWAGAYLATATIYATLFGRSPEGLPYHFGVSEEDAEFFQRIAWETVLEWRAQG